MFANLFITLPVNNPRSAPMSMTLPFILHMSIALARVILSAITIADGIRSIDRKLTTHSFASMLWLLAAIIAGAVYLFGGQNTIYSLVMVVGFLSAMFFLRSLSLTRAIQIRTSSSMY